MILTDLHMHTTFCDGKNTAEQMVLAAIQKGFRKIGFSGHSYTPFDEACCMSEAGTVLYRKEIARLKEKYRESIEILCGVEQDYYSTASVKGYDFVIGSVHYLKRGNRYISVDETPQIQIQAVKEYFGGDWYAFCECYFETVSTVVEQTGADIIGHMDLITKFNQGDVLFDTAHERYVAAWRQCADILLGKGALFEINTGAIFRGYRSEAYPGTDILRYLAQKGASFILSSDAHQTAGIGYRFAAYEAYIK